MKKILCIALLLLTFVFSLAACGDSPSIEISDDGYWVIDSKKTDVLAKGEKGDIGEQGIQGEKGDKGDDGLTPTIEISEDGYWIINGEKTDVKAKGEDGKDATPSDENPQGLDFYLKDDGTYAVEIGKAKYLSKIEIPGTYKGKCVTEISNFGGDEIQSNAILKEVTIPNTVTKIGDLAFCNCTALTTITLPESVSTIGEYAFARCGSLKDIYIQSELTYVGEGAFSGCEKLRNVFYAGSVEEWMETEISPNNYLLKEAAVYYDCDFQNLSFGTINGDTALSIIEEVFENSKKQSYWCVKVYNDGELTSAFDKNTVSSEYEELLFDIHNNQSPLENIFLGFSGEDIDLYEIGDKTVYALKNCPDGINLAISIKNGLVQSFILISRATNGHTNGQLLYYYEPVDIPKEELPEVSSPKVDISGFSSLSDFNNSSAIIGAQSGTYHYDALITQISGIEAKEYPDFYSMLAAIKAGAIDGCVIEEPTAISVIAQNEDLAYIALKNNSTGFTASDADTSIAVAFKTGSGYVAQVNAILAGISPETRSALMKQAVTMSSAPDTALTETIALVSSNTDISNGTLRIAMECAYDPFNWYQTTDVNGAVKIQGSDVYANGYDVQVAKYIAAELGMALEIYAVEWDSLIPGLQAGVYDGIIAGMSPTAERKEEVDFTDCYYNANLVIIYKKS